MNFEDAAYWLDTYCGREYGRMALGHAVALIQRNSVEYEYEASVYCADELRRLGFKVAWEAFAPRRGNVTALWGDESDVAIILNGHLDTVPAAGQWRYPPFDGVVADGLLHGRGSADMKGGCAAMLAAAACIAQNSAPQRGLMLILNGDEEHTNKGMKHLLKTRKPKAGACVIGEPTQMNIALGNKGYASYFIRTQGLACHGSAPEKGVNAIYKMGRVLPRLEAYADQLRAQTNHPQLGPAAFNAGVVSGGSLTNTVPEHCELLAERRILPGETPAQVLTEIQEAAGELAEVSERSWMDAGWLDENHPFVATAAAALTHVLGGKPEIGPFGAGTESSYFSVQCGIPTLIIGPGSLEQAHKTDECVPVKQLCEAVKAYALIAKMLLAKDGG